MATGELAFLIVETKQILEALGTERSIALGSFFGALVSLRFVDKSRTLGYKVLIVGAGCISAIELSPLIGHGLGVQDGGMGGLTFVLGLYGMSLADAVYTAIKDGTLVNAIRTRLGV